LNQPAGEVFMGRHFSLATLLLLMAIAAVAMASTRTALAGMWRGQSPGVVGLVVLGGLFGLAFGIGFALWNRGNWYGILGSIVGGPCLGAAAGVQLGVGVEWPVIFAAPFILIVTLLVVAANRRRRLAARWVETDPHDKV
jgi:hypothetical protein